MAADDTNQKGMTLPTLETFSFWSNVAVVALTVLAAIAGIFALYFSSRLGAAKDASLASFQTESGVALANANARAAEANATAKTAEQATADAVVQQRALEQRNIELATRLEQEHIARLKLEAAVAPRRLTREQSQTLVTELSPFRGNALNIMKLGDAEAAGLADDTINAFIESGWNVSVERVWLFSPPPYGFELSMEANLRNHPAILAIVRGLNKAGFKVDINAKWAKGVQLRVGLKPVPRP